jgi:predicted transcriptional regulator
MKKQILTIRVSDSLKNDLETFRERNGESISDITRKALEAYFHNATESESIRIEEAKQGENLKDESDFNFPKITSILLDKYTWFEDSVIIELYNKFKELQEDAKFDDDLKKKYVKEFRRAKKETDNVSSALLFYLDNLLMPKNGVCDFNFEDFEDFLMGLYSDVQEPHVVILNIPSL